MARPIKETPVLHGKAAKRFSREIKNVEKISDEKMSKINSSYEKLMAIAQFS